MEKPPYINFQRPENTGVLDYLRSVHPEIDQEDAIRDPDDFVGSCYAGLGTHPDVIAWLWRNLTSELPQDCQGVAYLRPVLVHPQTGVIFAFAMGTPTYALRLPKQEWHEALAEGYKTSWTYNDAWRTGQGSESNTILNLSGWGEGWVFGRWRQSERKLALAAYRFAEDSPAP